MCLIGFAWLAHPRWRLVLAANRDEFYRRPASIAGWWPDSPRVFGGRDLEAGGTWLAIDRRGRLAAVTNFREPVAAPGPRSRGELVAGFASGSEDIDDWGESVAARPDDWSGFSLLLFDLADPPRARYLSNRSPTASPVPIQAGVHGLSNHLLDSGWPKVRCLRERIIDALPGDALEPALLGALADDRVAPDSELPHTGLDIERERLLSAARIRSDEYGTRVSTIVLVDQEGRVEFVERTWAPDHDEPDREKRASFALDARERRVVDVMQ